MATIRPHKFAITASEKPPVPPDWVTWIVEGKKLTREQKDTIADRMYGSGGSWTGCIYRQAGWRWDLFRSPVLRRYLVSFKNSDGSFHVYYAPDKTALRFAFEGIDEIIGPVTKR